MVVLTDVMVAFSTEKKLLWHLYDNNIIRKYAI